MSRLFLAISEKVHNALNGGDKRSTAVKRNIIGSLAVKGGSILIQLILVPLTLGYLSDELYGIWLTVSSILLWLNFFDVGFTLGLKNRLAEALAQGDYSRGKRLVSTTYGMMLLIFGPLCVIMVIGVPWVDWSGFLNVSAEYNAQLTQVMRVLVVSFCLQMIFNTITAVLSAYQRVALASAFPVIGNFLSVIVIYILMKLVPASLVSLAVAISYLPVIVLMVSSVVLFRGELRPVSPDLRMFDRGTVGSLFSLGLKFFIIQIQMVVLYQSTNVLISNVSSPLDVTSYNIAYKYLGTALMTFTIVLGPLWPAFTDAYIKKEYAWMRQSYKRMIQLYGIMTVGVVLMTVVANFVYGIWVGQDVEVPFFMTSIVALYTLIQAWVTLQVTLINGIGAVKLQTYVTLIGLTCHIPLSLFLGGIFGAEGVVMSMCVINLIYGLVFTLQINKLLNYTKSAIWSA